MVLVLVFGLGGKGGTLSLLVPSSPSPTAPAESPSTTPPGEGVTVAAPPSPSPSPSLNTSLANSKDVLSPTLLSPASSLIYFCNASKIFRPVIAGGVFLNKICFIAL